MPTPRGADRLFHMAALGLLLLFVLRSVTLLALRYPVEYGEGTTWAYARLLKTHGTFYLPIVTEPYIHGTYPPVFPVLQAALGGSLRAGRTVALLGTLLAAGSFVAILEAFAVPRRRALLWGAVFLGVPAIHEWGATCRVDTLALGFSLLGLAIATRANGPRGERWAAAVLALAFFTKQVAVAAPVAVALGLWLRGERRRALQFAALYGGIVLFVMGVLQWRTNGELWRHLVTHTGFIGWHVGPFVRWAARFAFFFPVFLPLAFMHLKTFGRGPAGVYVLTGLAALLLAGKPGASANYLIEPSAALLLAAAVAAEARLGQLAKLGERGRDFSLLLVVQLIVLCQPGRPFEWLDLVRGNSGQAQLVSVVEAAAAPVLADDLGLVLAGGKEPMLEPFQFGFLARARHFDPAPVLASVRSGGFGVILLGPRLRSIPGLGEEIERSYQFSEEIAGLGIWRPPVRSTTPAPAPSPTPATAPRHSPRPRG